MAGIYVYQQIIKTPTEWESNESIYPSGVFLFEDLGDGKFNIALGDGVHRFVDLPKAFMNALVTVKTNTEKEYVLTITSPEGSFDTPNLKANGYIHPKFTPRNAGLYKITVNEEGHVSNATAVTKTDITALGIPAQDTVYTHPSYTARSAGLYKVTVDTQGHVSNVTAVTKADITALGIPAQDTTYPLATTSSNGLMSNTDKTNLDNSLRLTSINSVTTLASLPIDKYSIKATVSAATTMTFASTPIEGMEFMIDVLNTSSADITQALPNGSGWQSSEESVTLTAGAVTPISVRYIHGIYCVRV